MACGSGAQRSQRRPKISAAGFGRFASYHDVASSFMVCNIMYVANSFAESARLALGSTLTVYIPWKKLAFFGACLDAFCSSRLGLVS